MTATLEKNTLSAGCLVLAGVSWENFLSIEAAFANVEGTRFTYLDGVLEIMPVSDEHEDVKSTIGVLLEAYLRQMGIRFYVKGSPTMGDKNLGARKEPDESYSFGSNKPVPDLAIEVVISSGGVDKLEIYRRMGVPEVWFWEDAAIAIYVLLDAKEKYDLVSQSQVLPNLDLDLLVRFINYFDQYDAVMEFTKLIQQSQIA